MSQNQENVLSNEDKRELLLLELELKELSLEFIKEDVDRAFDELEKERAFRLFSKGFLGRLGY